jgi:hypothetical protein
LRGGINKSGDLERGSLFRRVEVSRLLEADGLGTSRGVIWWSRVKVWDHVGVVSGLRLVVLDFVTLLEVAVTWCRWLPGDVVLDFMVILDVM